MSAPTPKSPTLLGGVYPVLRLRPHELITVASDLLLQLEESTLRLEINRESMKQACTDRNGKVTDPRDRVALEHLDDLITRNKAAIAAARGGKL